MAIIVQKTGEIKNCGKRAAVAAYLQKVSVFRDSPFLLTYKMMAHLRMLRQESLSNTKEFLSNDALCWE